MKKKLPLFILTNNHFDPTWRRCWDRHLIDQGRVFRSYAEIEDYYMTDNLELCRKHPEYKFEAESTIVVRKYVERHPDKLPVLRRLAAAGRFAVPGAGDNIVDANMVLGESIVRNFLTGLLWVEDNLAVRTRVGTRLDGFGNSAQLPQIFRGCELPWAIYFSYSPLSGRYWRGLDGSVICHADISGVSAGGAGGYDKYPPCGRCRGKGCAACKQRGIEPTWRAHMPRGVNEKEMRTAGVGKIVLAPEELLPNPEIFAWVKRWRSKYDVRFAIHEDYRSHVQDWIDTVDAPPAKDVHPSVEANPNNSGVWVTRIKTKQNCRRQEYALLGAETLNCLVAMNGSVYPQREFGAIWEKLLFTMFHDAITATHVDAAYDEIRDIWAQIDTRTEKVRARAVARLVKPATNVLSVINCLAQPATQLVSAVIRSPGKSVSLRDTAGEAVPIVSAEKRADGCVAVQFVAEDVPALGARQYQVSNATVAPRVCKLSRPVIQNQRFRIEADAHGLLSIYDKRLKRKIAAAGGYRPNEMLLEHDQGSPWATLHPHRNRVALAEHTQLIAAESSAAYERLVFHCEPPGRDWSGNKSFRCETAVTLYRGLDRVDFVTDVNWNAFNTRVRVAMPLTQPGRHMYGIPYGMLERKPYAPKFEWASANGDWPAINWAGVEGKTLAVALLNKGIPSYCIEKGPAGRPVMLLSILRSPTTPTYLHEPESYTMTAYDGMRDEGSHHFEYALTAYDQRFAASEIVADAEAYNAGLQAMPGRATLPPPPITVQHAQLSALKWAEKGDALVARVFESRGKGSVAEITVTPRIKRVLKVNMLERQGQALHLQGAKLRLPLRPWEIATLRLELA